MIQCMYSAKKYVRDELFNGKSVTIKTLNEGRHFIVKCNDKKYYCAYKREPYHTFAKEFDFSENVEGESLNAEFIKEAQRQDCDSFIFIYPEGAKEIQVRDFLTLSLTNNWFRIVKTPRKIKALGGKEVYVDELTYSIPQTVLKSL